MSSLAMQKQTIYNASWTLKSNVVGDNNSFVMKYTYVST